MNAIVRQISEALKELNGVATLKELYDKVPYPSPTIRRTIQQHSSDTSTKPKKEDIFFSVNGLGNGVWGLRNFTVENVTSQVDDNSTARKLTTYQRIIRDTVLANEIKKIVDYKCQLCELSIELPGNKYYIEAHHIKPLGAPYNGPDRQNNILIVCPNCHVKCDYKLIKLDLAAIKNNCQKIDQHYIDFHNDEYEIRIRSL